jgi:hypothetical protein
MRRLRLGVLLLALSGLVYQVALTRYSSAAFNYHLTFLVLSAAMLGTGAGGTWVALRVRAGSLDDDRRRLRALAVAAAGTTAAVGAALSWLPLASADAPQLLAALIAGYVLAALPHFFSGAAIALALRATPASVAGTYGADLLGAGAGCLVALGLLELAGPPWALAGATLAALGAARVIEPYGRARVPAVVAGLLALAVGLAPPGPANVIPSKPLAVFLNPVLYPNSSLQHTRWDATSRVDVFTAPGVQLLWGLGTVRDPAVPELRGITIDADALTAVLQAEPGETPGVVRQLPTSLPYQVGPRRDVLVIGPGGGVDVAAALHFGAQRVEAVEINRALAELLLGPLSSFSGGLYRRPGVSLVVDEGRGYLERSSRRYDAIVLTAVDSWAALAHGAYSLSENYLYTQEAMAAYYQHLADGGVLAVSRWYTRPPRELQRLTIMAAGVLRDEAAAAEGALLLLKAGDFGTLLVRRGTFTLPEIERARRFAAAGGFTLVFEPSMGSEALRNLVAPVTAAEPAPAGTTPRGPTDDRPYFFDFVPWSSVFTGRFEGPLPRGHAVLLVALVQGLCLAALCTVLPVRRLSHSLTPLVRLLVGAYCAAVGLGFMLAEVAVLQRSTLLLGQPSLSLAVTLAGLLAGAGAGSALASVRAGGGAARWLPLLAGGLLIAHARLGPSVVEAGLSLPLPARIAIGLGTIAPLGLVLGPALPTGLQELRGRGAAAIPWAWGINGAASVVGATLATMLAMEAGNTAVLLAAAGSYLAAAACLHALSRRNLVPGATAN